MRLRASNRRVASHEQIARRREVTLAARSFRGSDTRPGAVAYALTRSPDAAELSMAAMTWWRRTASAKSGTVCVPLPVSAANAAQARPTLQAGVPSRLVSGGHFWVSAAGSASSAGSLRPCAPAAGRG